MTSEQWNKIKGLFDAALDVSPAKRAKFLKQACGADVALRREVENLLASFEDAEEFLEKPAAAEVASLIIERNGKLKSGERVAHYETVRQIGEGGMGEVYLARDTRLNRKVALKVLPSALTVDRSRLQRFKQEAQAASALNHPNIITIYEIREYDGTHLIATEFVEGETLRQKMSGAVNLSLNEILDVFIQIASALSVAHSAGVIHRDIKPENIMIRPDGIVKLLDFGLAKLSEPSASAGGFNADIEASQSSKKLTNPGMVMGTVNYMSPEQAQGAQVDHRTDLWSLGVCLYEMLSGALPFSGKTVNHTLVAIMEQAPAPLAQNSHYLSADLEKVLTKLLAKERRERYQTAADLLADLRDAQKNPATKSQAETSSAAFKTPPTGESSQSVSSIAVLPFLTLGLTEEEEYLGLGLADALITQLSQTRRLSVRPTNAVRSYTDARRDAAEIGEKLNVGAVLEGNLQKSGERLRVTVQLINTEAGATLWADKFNVNFTDFFEVQDQIAEQVSRALLLTLNTSEQTQINKRFTESNAAYLEYLKGRHFWEKRDVEGFHKAIEHYKRAIDFDPTYALAYVGLSDAFCMLGIWAEFPADEIFPRAKAAAQRALEIDEKLADAHASLGRVQCVYEWDWAAAENSYLRAIQLNPNCMNAHSWLAKVYVLKHRYSEAIEESRIAQRLDPLSPQAEVSLAAAHFYARRYTEAVERYRKAVEMHQGFVPAIFGLGMCLAEKGEFAEAVALQEKAVELSKNHPLIEGFLAATYAYSGNREKALEFIEKFKSLEDKALDYTIAAVYARLNEREKAFEYLEKAFDASYRELSGLSIEPEFDNLRGEPLFNEMLRRVGLEEAIIEPPEKQAEKPAISISSGEIETLAILPFATMGLSDEEEYLSLGLADALITQLSRTKQLAVRPTSAVRGFINSNRSVSYIGRELRVGAILEGSLQRAGERIRVTVQLVDTTSETSLWAEKFLFNFTDIFDVQDEIAVQVANALPINMNSAEREKLKTRWTQNAEAYQLYLKGRFYLAKSDPESLPKAVSLFEQTIALAPEAAPAYAGLAESYIIASFLAAPHESLSKAREAAERAVQLDAQSAEARVALGVVKMQLDWDWHGAESEYKHALEINPNDAKAYLSYALFLTGLRRFTEAFRMFEKGLRIDPLSVQLNGYFGFTLVAAGEADKAIEQCRKTLELEPRFLPAHGFMAYAFWSKGDFERAVEIALHQCQIQRAPITLSNLAHAYASNGQEVEARQILAEIEAAPRCLPIYPATVYLGLNEHEKMWNCLEQAFEQKSILLPGWLNADPRFQVLSDDRRFQEMLRRLGLE